MRVCKANGPGEREAETVAHWLAMAEHILRRELPELFVRDSESDRIRRRVAASGVSAEIDYAVHALAFNRAYFFKNLYKAVTALQRFAPMLPPDAHIVDVGAGAGVFATAWALVMGDPAAVLLVDRAPAQLALARRVLGAFGVTRCAFRQGDFTAAPSEETSLQLFSYWWCEQRELRVVHNWPDVMARLGGRGVIVDYGPVLDELIRAGQHAYAWQRCDLHAAPADPIATLVRDDQFIVHAAYYAKR